MKTIILSALIILFNLSASDLLCQTPGRVWYQTVVTNSSGSALTNSNVGLKLSVLQGSAVGTTAYSETFSVATDNRGVVAVELGGGGTPQSGSFGSIDWSAGPYFLGVEIDSTGGTAYVSAGVAQLLSVPSAFHAGRGGQIEVSVSAVGDTVYVGSDFVIVPGASVANTPPPVAPAPDYASGYVHCNGATVVSDVTNPLTGQTWMDRNLGASRVATAYNDADSYGDLFQWGRFADGHQCRTSATTSFLANTAVSSNTDVWYGQFITNSSDPYDWLETQDSALWQSTNGVNNPCPAGYRLPTISEWEEERNSWNEFNRSGAMASPLKLPAPGFRRNNDGSFADVGSFGDYWSSSVSGGTAWHLYFSFDLHGILSNRRAYGLSVRCLKDPH